MKLLFYKYHREMNVLGLTPFINQRVDREEGWGGGLNGEILPAGRTPI